MATNILIIGAGFTGLAAAYDLARAGHKVTVMEAEGTVGGLAGAFETAGERLERFYHHWFTSDREIMRLIEELGLLDQTTFSATSTGVYYNRTLFRLSTPLDLLRFKALPFLDRIRLGLLTLRARRIKDWRKLEHMTAADWLRRLGGRKVWEIMWEPLMKGKFGPYAESVSAVWFWNKLKLRGGSRGNKGEEQLAYLKGSFARLADEIAASIRSAGGDIRLNSPVTRLEKDAEGRWTASGPWGELAGDAVIATTAPPVLADMLADTAEPDYLAELRRIPYLANVCLVLELDRSLGSTYWLNVNDPGFPYVGIIEHTKFEAPENYGGSHIVYLSKYLPDTDELYNLSDSAVLEFSIPHIREMFPEFGEGWIRRYHVWRARWAQPVVECHYSRLMPKTEAPLDGLFLASMAQIYPEDRGTNYAVREGRRIAARVSENLSDGPA